MEREYKRGKAVEDQVVFNQLYNQLTKVVPSTFGVLKHVILWFRTSKINTLETGVKTNRVVPTCIAHTCLRLQQQQHNKSQRIKQASAVTVLALV